MGIFGTSKRDLTDRMMAFEHALQVEAKINENLRKELEEAKAGRQRARDHRDIEARSRREETEKRRTAERDLRSVRLQAERAEQAGAELMRKLGEANKQLDEARSSTIHLRNRNDNQRRTLEGLESAHQHKVRSLLKVIEEKDERIKELAENVRDRAHDMAEADQTYRDEIERLTKELNIAHREIGSVCRANLFPTKSELQTEVHQLRKTCETFDKERAALQNEIRGLMDETEELALHLKASEQEVNRLRADRKLRIAMTGRMNGKTALQKELSRLTVTDLVRDAHQNAINKGWYEEPRSFGEYLAFIHSELSEALEDHRNGKGLTEVWHEYSPKDFPRLGKPCGIPSELADVVIRVADLCGHLGINLEAAITEKMAYNATRPHRHGGKKL